MVILKRTKIILSIGVLLVATLIPTFAAVHATNYCVTDACKKAAQDEADAKEKAADATASANTLAGEIARLNSEISILEAEIKTQEIAAEELKKQIEFNEAKLDQDQNALAELLIDMHLSSNTSTIMILAGSDSISDLTEKQSRQDTVKEQVATAADEVKKLKEQLEKEKAQVEAIIESLSEKRSEIAANKARQTELMNKYRDDASAYSKDADEARKIKEREIQAEIDRHVRERGGGVITDPGLNSYAPALASAKGMYCPNSNWRYIGYCNSNTMFSGGCVCECTSYAGYKARERWGVVISSWGDAKYWGGSARAAGYTTTTYAEAQASGKGVTHTIGYSIMGTWGHVVWVEHDNGNGTINISEYNGAYTANFSYVTGVSAYKYNYIHFD